MSVEKLIKQEENRKTIIDLLRSVERDGIDELIGKMDEIGYFTSPASTQYHLAYEGGLAEHSLNVYSVLSSFAESVGYENYGITHDNIVIVSLLHDITKSGFLGQSGYIPNILKNGEISKAKPYEKNKQMVAIDHEVSAIVLISQYIKLEPDEMTAILYHNGLYTPIGRSYSGKESGLYILLHAADMFTSRCVESKGTESED